MYFKSSEENKRIQSNVNSSLHSAFGNFNSYHNCYDGQQTITNYGTTLNSITLKKSLAHDVAAV